MLNRTASTSVIAPSFSKSAADKAAFVAARGSIRAQASNGDGWFPVVEPNGSWLSPAGREALRRADAATRRILDEDYDAALKARGLAEYDEYVGSAAA